MNLKDLGKSIVSKGLPLLGGLIGGNAGESLGNTVAELLGCDPTPESIENALQDEDNILALKKYVMDHEKELQSLALQESQAYLADRQNARSREVELTKVTGKKDINMIVLAWTVVIGFFALCVILMKLTVPDGQSEIIYMLFGSLSTGFISVLSYYFGSSKGSSDKTKLLSEVSHV
jgi:hypothetical protein